MSMHPLVEFLAYLGSLELVFTTPRMKGNWDSSVNTGEMARGCSMLPTVQRIPTSTRWSGM